MIKTKAKMIITIDNKDSNNNNNSINNIMVEDKK